MANNFTLTLDTTSPAGVSITLEGGAGYTAGQDITATIATSDTPTTGYQMKIWGNVDVASNANIQATEGASSWIAFSTSQAVRLATGDGSKTVHLKVRDDVWNESSDQTDSITLDTSLPVVTITVGPDVSKISKVTGKRTCSFSFQSDIGFDEYKVKVVPATGSLNTAGVQIPTTAGSTNMSGSAGGYAATTNINCTIDGADLETAASGDGAKIVKVFVKEHADEDDSWSV